MKTRFFCFLFTLLVPYFNNVNAQQKTQLYFEAGLGATVHNKKEAPPSTTLPYNAAFHYQIGLQLKHNNWYMAVQWRGIQHTAQIRTVTTFQDSKMTSGFGYGSSSITYKLWQVQIGRSFHLLEKAQFTPFISLSHLRFPTTITQQLGSSISNSTFLSSSSEDSISTKTEQSVRFLHKQLFGLGFGVRSSIVIRRFVFGLQTELSIPNKEAIEYYSSSETYQKSNNKTSYATSNVTTNLANATAGIVVGYRIYSNNRK